jgi:hypothetical protein
MRTMLTILVLCLLLPAQTAPASSARLVPVCSVAPPSSCILSGCCIRISPTTPTNTDAIQIEVSGIGQDTCIPRYQTYTIVGNEISVHFIDHRSPLDICGLALTPWGHTIDIGVLPKGTYRVSSYVNDTLCGGAIVAVTEEPKPVFLPMVMT